MWRLSATRAKHAACRRQRPDCLAPISTILAAYLEHKTNALEKKVTGMSRCAKGNTGYLFIAALCVSRWAARSHTLHGARLFHPAFIENHGQAESHKRRDLSTFLMQRQSQLPGTYYVTININKTETARNVDFQTSRRSARSTGITGLFTAQNQKIIASKPTFSNPGV